MKINGVLDPLNSSGVDALPIILADDKIVKTRKHPVNEEFVSWLGVNVDKFHRTKAKEVMRLLAQGLLH